MTDWRCTRCGNIIGAYEPIVVASEHGHRLTSRVAEPDLPFVDGARFHRACHVEHTSDGAPLDGPPPSGASPS